jgi:uncharacterized RDD family membrane protein YckC
MPPPDDKAPEPDAETTRVPVGAEPSDEPPDEPPPNEPPPPPPAGIISAEPVGWAGPAQRPTETPPGRPTVAWARPAAPVTVSAAEGLVIAGVFPRIVAYCADSLLIGAINVAFAAVLGVYDSGGNETVGLILSVILVGVDLLYFVGLWTSGLQATLGMRLVRLKVLGAATAGTLSVNDALLRWLALAGALSIIGLVPGIARYSGILLLFWILALLVTTATNPLHQGLHDRWARSVVVQPAPGGAGAAILTCLVLVLLVGVVMPLAFLVLAGDQIQDLLTEIGRSV